MFWNKIGPLWIESFKYLLSVQNAKVRMRLNVTLQIILF